MKTICFIAALLFFMSCDSDELNYSDLPQCDLPLCIEHGIINENVKTVRAQELNGELHYWINTGANSRDGDELIVNEHCEMVCYFGGWIHPDCLNAYSEDWIIVWSN